MQKDRWLNKVGKNVQYTFSKSTDYPFFFLARSKKVTQNISNQSTPQTEYRSTVRRSSGVTQSQRKYFISDKGFRFSNLNAENDLI